MEHYKTEQEGFWAGTFGNDYTDRNNDINIFAGDIFLFSKIIERTNNIKKIIEFGANIGLNLRAIKTLLPNCELSAIEINKKACEILSKNIDKVYNQSILDFQPDYERDLVLLKTVLIHINPAELNRIYDLIYKTSKKYICIAEYYSPSPVSIEYRGHKERLYKRDFAGELLDKFSDLKLVDYGFAYHRDNNFSLCFDDMNWFLLEKV